MLVPARHCRRRLVKRSSKNVRVPLERVASQLSLLGLLVCNMTWAPFSMQQCSADQRTPLQTAGTWRAGAAACRCW